MEKVCAVAGREPDDTKLVEAMRVVDACVRMIPPALWDKGECTRGEMGDDADRLKVFGGEAVTGAPATWPTESAAANELTSRLCDPVEE